MPTGQGWISTQGYRIGQAEALVLLERCPAGGHGLDQATQHPGLGVGIADGMLLAVVPGEVVEAGLQPLEPDTGNASPGSTWRTGIMDGAPTPTAPAPRTVGAGAWA